MKVLIDMNLAPRWCGFLTSHGVDAVHWSEIGPPDADDVDIMERARREAFVVLTNDLDFGTLLALTQAARPSVVLLRGPKVLVSQVGLIVADILAMHAESLLAGALVVIDDRRYRVRILPLESKRREK